MTANPGEFAAQIDRLRRKLDQAARLPRKSEKSYLKENSPDFSRFFGADTHQFRMNPPLSPQDALAWEQRYRASLPTPYRCFLEQVGNGGAGPDYGLLPLDRWGDGANVSDEALLDWPSTPCLLREDFPNVPDREAWLAEIGGLDWEARIDDESWGPMVGTLTLCDGGCGGYCYLVLNGPLTGRVCYWEQSIKPKFRPFPNFLDWYEDWLDYVVTGMPRSRRG